MAIQLSDLNILWQGVPSSNFAYGRGGEVPIAIVNHIMDGYKWGTKATFQNPANQVSTHFAIHWDGSIWQYVHEQDTAYGNGIEQDMDLSVPALAYAAKKGLNPNRITISIEHEGLTGQIFPEAQIQASLKLNAYLKAKYGISDNNIIGHNRIERYDRANCPGKTFFWTRLFSFVNNIIEAVKDIKVMSFQDAVTGKYVVEPFASAYAALRNDTFSPLEIAGRPLTGMVKDTNGRLYQDFERLRFELPAGASKVQFARSNAELRGL